MRFEVEEFDKGWQARLVADNGEPVWRTTAGEPDQLYENRVDALHAIDLVLRAGQEGVPVVYVEKGDGGRDVAGVVYEREEPGE